jgi:integrase
LRRAFKRYLEWPAEELSRAAVVRALDALRRPAIVDKDENAAGVKLKGTAMAIRTAAYGRAVYGWALKRDTVERNPFANLPVPASPSKRERVLTDDEVTRVWHATSADGLPYGQIIRLLILTGQRREEVAGMKWAELSDDLSAWTIPGSRTKNGMPHIVPLNSLANELVRGLLPVDAMEARVDLYERRRELTLVVPGVKGTPFGGWSKSKTELDKASKVSDWRVHDLRRTLATGLQRLGVRLEVTEAVLNHISGSRAGIIGVYQRHNWADEKRMALEAWATHLATLVVGEQQPSNVVLGKFRQS